MTVAELGDRMSHRELIEWMEYAELEPFGDQRGDLRSAISTTAIVRAVAGKSARHVTPKLFMPFLEDTGRKEFPTEARPPEVLAAKFSALMGG